MGDPPPFGTRNGARPNGARRSPACHKQRHRDSSAAAKVFECGGGTCDPTRLDPSAQPADVAASRVVLAKLQLPTDSGLPVELWRVDDHHRVAFVGDDAATKPSLNVGGEDGLTAALFRPGLDSVSARDSVQLGQIYSSGGRTYFWIAIPVLDSGRAIGFIVKQGRIAANPQTERTVRELVGDSVAGYYHNADGTGWTTFGGTPTQPTIRSLTDSAVHTRPGVGTVIFAEQRVAGQPLVLAMEVSERVTLSSARRTVRALGTLSVVLVIAGAGLAWVIGGRVARPITVLTEASDAIARGNYETRVSATGSREMSRLAATFNRMAGQIGESRIELERREAAVRALADTIPQLAWMADSDGRVFWFNKRWTSTPVSRARIRTTRSGLVRTIRRPLRPSKAAGPSPFAQGSHSRWKSSSATFRE